MPLYDYHCQKCENIFTELRKTSEIDYPINCPECRSIDTIRSLSRFSVGGTTSGITAVCGPSKSQFRWST